MSTKVSVTPGDCSLFHVAASATGNALNAPRLAQLSSMLSDPWIWAPATVTIPDDPGPDCGGLPAPGTGT